MVIEKNEIYFSIFGYTWHILYPKSPHGMWFKVIKSDDSFADYMLYGGIHIGRIGFFVTDYMQRQDDIK